MRETLLTINVVYFLFGATIYCGVMWSLRFFFYPSWSKMTVDNVQDHFIIPTSAATRFSSSSFRSCSSPASSW